jgi:putative endonuclease
MSAASIHFHIARPDWYPQCVVHRYFIYILASQSGVLYTGVTNDLNRRIGEHKEGRVPGFAKKYRVERLVYYEAMGDINAAIAREKQIKRWRREKKVALIETINPGWDDLARELAPF